MTGDNQGQPALDQDYAQERSRILASPQEARVGLARQAADQAINACDALYDQASSSAPPPATSDAPGSYLPDPGCVQGKTVVLANADLGGGTDLTVVRSKLGTLIDGLDKAAAVSQHDQVREAMTNLRNDYKSLLDSLAAGQGVSSSIDSQIGSDANMIDTLCTIGGSTG
jgi:hypothetical protein